MNFTQEYNGEKLIFNETFTDEHSPINVKIQIVIRPFTNERFSMTYEVPNNENKYLLALKTFIKDYRFHKATSNSASEKLQKFCESNENSSDNGEKKEYEYFEVDFYYGKDKQTIQFDSKESAEDFFKKIKNSADQVFLRCCRKICETSKINNNNIISFKYY